MHTGARAAGTRSPRLVPYTCPPVRTRRLAERPTGFFPTEDRQAPVSQALRLPLVSSTQRPAAARHARPSPAAGASCSPLRQKPQKTVHLFPQNFVTKKLLERSNDFLFILLKIIVILRYRQNATHFFPHRSVQKAHQGAVFGRHSPNAALTSRAKHAFVQTTAACRQWVLLG